MECSSWVPIVGTTYSAVFLLSPCHLVSRGHIHTFISSSLAHRHVLASTFFSHTTLSQLVSPPSSSQTTSALVSLYILAEVIPISNALDEQLLAALSAGDRQVHIDYSSGPPHHTKALFSIPPSFPRNE